MYRVSIRNIENMAVPMMNMATFEAVSVCSRKMEKGTSGSSCRCSQRANAASRTSEAANTPIVLPESHPHCCPCVTPRTRSVSPEVTSTAPGMSWLCPCASLLSREQDRGQRQRGDADGDVDEEDPLPGEDVGEDSTQEHARGGPEAADGAPRAEGDVPLATLGERGRQDRQRRGCDRRGSQALQSARTDQATRRSTRGRRGAIRP